MTIHLPRDKWSLSMDRRKLLGMGAAAGLGAAALRVDGLLAQSSDTGVDAETWTPEYISSIAGTLEVDTAAETGAVVPHDYTGRVTYWYAFTPETEPAISLEQDEAFWAAFGEAYPNIGVEFTRLNYNDALDKTRTAA